MVGESHQILLLVNGQMTMLRFAGGSAPVSPRRTSELFVAKSPFPSDPHGQSADANMATPRTNRTLFIHGRFSA